MKKRSIFLLGFIFLFCAFSLPGLTVSAAPINTVLAYQSPHKIIKDTYVQTGSGSVYDDGTSGNMYNLMVKRDSTSYNNYYAFIQVDLSSLTGSIIDANLLLNCKGIESGGTYPQTIGVYEAPSSYVWPQDPSDNGVHFNNAPELGAAIPGATASVTGTGTVTIDVSAYVIREYNLGNKKINLYVWAPTNGKFLLFDSKESSVSNGPRLSVNTTTVPTVSMTAPYNNSYYNTGDSVTVSANVKATGAGVTISSVVFKLDDVAVEGVPTAVGSIYSLDIPNLTEGSHTIRVVATNSDGGITTSPPVTIKVLGPETILTKLAPKTAADGAYINMAQPTTNFGSPSTYSLLLKNDAINTNDMVPYLKFDLSDIVDTVVNATVQLNCSGVQTVGQTPQAVQVYQITDDTWTSTGLLSTNAPVLGSAIPGAVSTISGAGDIGNFDITSYVKSQLAANDKSVSMAFFTESATGNYISFDSRYATNIPKILITTTKAPVVEIISPANGARLNPSTAFAISSTVIDLDGTIASVIGYLDGKEISLNNEGNNYSATGPGLPVGSHTFTIKATDNLGAITEMTNTFDVDYSCSVISSVFTDSLTGTGNVVTALAQGTELRSNITIKNNDTIDLSSTIIIVLYDSNHSIMQVNFKRNEDIAAGQQADLNVGFTLPDVDLTGCYVKVYLWDSLSKMKPLIPYIKLPTP